MLMDFDQSEVILYTETGNRTGKWDYRLMDSVRSTQLWRAVIDDIDSDVQIWAGRTKFAAHRCVLSARSVVFQR